MTMLNDEATPAHSTAVESSTGSGIVPAPSVRLVLVRRSSPIVSR